MYDLNYEKRKELAEDLSKQGIRDKKVLAAILKIKRENFVSPEFRRFAYDNNALPINANQTISQPYTVAYMTSLLNILPGEKVLEIGTGSGYQAAILCELGADVYSIERIPELHKQAGEILSGLGYKVHLKCGDGTLGWKQHMPYDKIIVTAGSPKIPNALLEQLKPFGKMVIPIGNDKVQVMNVVKKVETESGGIKYMHKTLDDFRFVPLIGEQAWKVK